MAGAAAWAAAGVEVLQGRAGEWVRQGPWRRGLGLRTGGRRLGSTEGCCGLGY